MKLRKFFQQLRSKFQQLDQRGQSLVEFVLLLVVVAGISFMFVAFMNRNLGRYWEFAVNLIITDQPGKTEVTMQ